ncbi:MAG: HAD-IB family hydrolase [Campylobacter sp.]
MNNIAFFDFDGTITRRDTLFDFLRFSFGGFRFAFGIFLISPILIAFKLKIVSNIKAKEYLLSWFLKNISIMAFLEMADLYSLNRIDKITKRSAMKKILWHKKAGDVVVVVSASPKYWLEPWCIKNNLELLATSLEVKNGVITGKISGQNCYGYEKVRRILQVYDLDKFGYVYVYGDSKGDREMLYLGDYKFYKFFKD